MRVKLTIFFTLLAAAFIGYSAGYLTPQSSAPVPVVETPKQPYHVVYFWVCSQLIGTLLTTEPATWHRVQDGLPDSEIVDMMIAVEGTSRSLNIKHWHPGCFKLAPITPPKIKS